MKRKKWKKLPNFGGEHVARFWAMVAVGGEGECWEWQGCQTKDGYGIFTFDKQNFISSRIAYKLTTGNDPGDLQVCHSCDNPACCNPSHLWLGTKTQNMQDAVSKKRMSRGAERWSAKLTEEQVREIRESSETLNTLAQRYGVSFQQISRIRRGERWREQAEAI